jgi:hypothetical protein
MTMFGEQPPVSDDPEKAERTYEQTIRMQCAAMALQFALNVLAHAKTPIDITKTAAEIAAFVLDGDFDPGDEIEIELE